MNLKRKAALVLLFGLFTFSQAIFAHTSIDSDAGILSNIIALGLVITFIIIFFFVSKKKKRNNSQKEEYK